MSKKENENYSDLLKDPRWQKRRMDILSRDNWTCQICGAKDKTLHVHHLCYEKGKKPWEYNDRQLITLCRDCHEYELYERILSSVNDLRYQDLTLYEINELLTELSFKHSYNSFVIKDFCYGLKSDGQPYTVVLRLEKLAERRRLIASNNNI